ERVKNNLCRLNSGFDSEMDPFQPLSVQQRGGIAGYQQACRRKLRNCIPAAHGHGLGAVPYHLAAPQEIPDQWMGLETLKLVMRIDSGISIVETHDMAYVNDPVPHTIDPRPTKGMGVEGPAGSVDD